MPLTIKENKLLNKLLYKKKYGSKEGRKKNALRIKLYRQKKKLSTLTTSPVKTKLNTVAESYKEYENIKNRNKD